MDSHPSARAYAGGNAVLDRLSPGERETLLPQLHVFFEEEAAVLHLRDQPIHAVRFPIHAVYSVVVELAQGHAYEVGMIGRFGAVGAEAMLGARVGARTVLCLVEGLVAQVTLEDFLSAIDRNRTFFTAVRDSLRRRWFESEQTIACNFAHTIEQRAARWILMTHDQTGHDHFPMRAEFLAIMLGVGIENVSRPMRILSDLGCIRYENEELTLLSRRDLGDYVCECYDRQRTAPFVMSDRPA